MLPTNQNMDAPGVEVDHNRGDWMSVYTGGMFFCLDPKPEEVFIEDISHALSQQNRFNGHLKWPYTVAQHSVLCSKYVEGDEETQFLALMHDAAEAYIGDLIRPIKVYMPSFKEIEDRIMGAVLQKFGIVATDEMWSKVKTIDNLMCAAEKRDMHPTKADWVGMPDPAEIPNVKPWGPSYAKGQFTKRFNELYKG